MKKFTLKMFLIACAVLFAAYSQAQVKLGSKSSIGQTYAKDATTLQADLAITFNTDKSNSTWEQVNDTTVNFSWAKCQTNKGFACAVYVADSANASTVINNDLRVREGRWRSNENPVRVASIDSLQNMLKKWGDFYAGTSDSTTNSIDKPSACLFDVDATNQVYGVHPGIYKKIEHEFVFTFKSMVMGSDLSFTVDTYDEGNTGKTATYSIGMEVSGLIDSTIENFYVTGSVAKEVNLAETFGLEISDLDGAKEVHIYFNTTGTDTEIAEGVYDPTIVFDDFKVSFSLAAWLTPDAGIESGGVYSNSDDPVVGTMGVKDSTWVYLKTKKRSGDLKIVYDLQDPYSCPFTFPDTLALYAADDNGEYTIPVEYDYTASSYNSGEMTYSGAEFVVSAPDTGTVNDDMALKVYFTAENPITKYDRFELDCGSRIWYDLYYKGAGTVVDLSEVEDNYILKDTLPGVPDDAKVLLAPGKTYYIGGYSFDKSMEITTSDASSDEKPIILCGSPADGYGSNFNMVADAAVDYIVFRNLDFSGDFENNYIMNISNQSSIANLLFESCNVSSLRGVVRIKSNPSTIDNFTVLDCVIDSIKNYGLFTMDEEEGAINNIDISNSTFSHFEYFIVSKNNSETLSIDQCTFYDVPKKGKEFLRYRTSGNDNITEELTITNSLIGHGWDMENEGSYAIKGCDGLESTEIEIKKVYATSDFAYSGDTLQGFPSDMLTETSDELWIDPEGGNFNYKDASFSGIGSIGDPRWEYEDTSTSVLYAGCGSSDEIDSGDSTVMAHLKDMGYNVSYIDDNDLVAGYDYSSYKVLVIGESVSSSKVIPFGSDNFPIPLVSLEGMGVKTNKWGWLTDDTNFQESRTESDANVKMKILDNSNYITETFTADQELTLSTAAASSDIYAWGIDLSSDVSEAEGLGQNMNSEITAPMLWAIPENTTLGASSKTTENRIVIFAINANALKDITADFDTIIDRSIEWVLGANGTGTSSPQISTNELEAKFFPNPVSGDQATLRFSVEGTQEVSFSVYNLLGQKMIMTTSEVMFEGSHDLTVNTSELGNGMYIYLLKVGDEVSKGKFNVVK